MAATEPTITLTSGHAMPRVGLDTATLVEPQIAAGIGAGARHLDCARMYGNEAAVGRAVKASGVPRAAFFLTSKLFMTELRRDAVGEAVADTLQDLQTDYLDLLLIHWPLKYKKHTLFARDGPQTFGETWAAMEALVAVGKVRSIGVSNFDAAQLEALRAAATITPAVNQIEAHPRFPNQALVDWCLARKIAVVAWGPLAAGRGRLAEDVILWAAANMHQVSVSRLALRWNLERGVCVIPRSANPDHVRDALRAAAGPRLSKDDAALLARSRPPGRRRFPDLIGVWPASANVAWRLLGLGLHFVCSVLFLVCSIDVVATAKRRAVRREAAYAAFVFEQNRMEAAMEAKIAARAAVGKHTFTDGSDDANVDPAVGPALASARLEMMRCLPD